MINSSWSNVIYYRKETDESLCTWSKSCIQKIINFYGPESFHEIENINVNNLHQFLKVLLKNYQYYNISLGSLMELGDAIEEYFKRIYVDHNWWYPNYPKTDRRLLSLLIIDNCMATTWWWPILPQDVPFLLECLNISDELIIYMEGKLNAYFNQFDLVKRCNAEIPRRWEVITRQRKEALEKGEPLPIRPMGIELDMCYKDK